jgi:hypothetical protein
MLRGHFRFLNIQKAAMPMMQATATTAIIAMSVLISGASTASVTSGSVGVGSVGPGATSSNLVGAGVAGCSGSIAADGDGASSTVK